MTVATALIKRATGMNKLKIAAWIIGVLVFLIVGVFVVLKIRDKLREKEERKKIDYVEGGGTIAAGFQPAVYADKMFDAMDGVFTTANTKAQAAYDLMQLTDNELIAVHNYWNEKLYDRNSETMYKMMDAEWNVPAVIIGSEENPWTALLNRLSRLNLISK